MIFYSCETNKFSFDEKNQELISKNHLSKIIIENLSTGDIVLIKKKNKSNRLSFNEMDTLNYFYFEDFLETKKLEKFSLNPNTQYKIENASVGDVTNYSLLLKTDNKGMLKSFK